MQPGFFKPAKGQDILLEKAEETEAQKKPHLAVSPSTDHVPEIVAFHTGRICDASVLSVRALQLVRTPLQGS